MRAAGRHIEVVGPSDLGLLEAHLDRTGYQARRVVADCQGQLAYPRVERLQAEGVQGDTDDRAAVDDTQDAPRVGPGLMSGRKTGTPSSAARR